MTHVSRFLPFSTAFVCLSRGVVIVCVSVCSDAAGGMLYAGKQQKEGDVC